MKSMKDIMERLEMRQDTKGNTRGRHGFTLVEVLVAMFIGLVVAVMLFIVMDQQSARYTGETEVTMVQQRLGSVLDLITNEIKHAGYLDRQNAIILADENTFTFRADVDTYRTGDALATSLVDENRLADTEGGVDEKDIEEITYHFVPPDLPMSDTSVPNSDPRKHNGTLWRQQVFSDPATGALCTDATPVTCPARPIATGLDNVRFEYYDADGNPLGNPEVGYAQITTDDGWEDKLLEIRRVRILITDSTTSAGAAGINPATATSEQLSQVETRTRTVVREVAPPNLGAETLPVCGEMIVKAPNTSDPLQACSVENNFVSFNFTTYDYDENGVKDETNENDVIFSVTSDDKRYDDPSSEPLPYTAYSDSDLTTIVTSPFEDGVRSAELQEVYIDPENDLMPESTLNIELEWRPPGACPVQRYNWPVKIGYSDPCSLEISAVESSDLHVCDNGGDEENCPKVSKVEVYVKDMCGNPPKPGTKVYAQILDSGLLYDSDPRGSTPVTGVSGTLELETDPDYSAGSSVTGYARFWYEADENATLSNTGDLPVNVSVYLDPGSLADPSCNAGSMAGVTFNLRPCYPWRYSSVTMDEGLLGCMNGHYPLNIQMTDQCGNVITNFNPMTGSYYTDAEYGTAVLTRSASGNSGTGENVAEYKENVDEGINPSFSNPVKVRPADDNGLYRVIYNTRTDEQFFTNSTITIDLDMDVYGKDGSLLSTPDLEYTFNYTFGPCLCNLYAIYKPEYFCDLAGGITYGCSDFMVLNAHGSCEQDDNYGVVSVEQPLGLINLYNGDEDDLSSLYQFNQNYTDHMLFDSTVKLPDTPCDVKFWMNGNGAVPGTDIRLKLEEFYGSDDDDGKWKAGDVACWSYFDTKVLCSEAEIDFIDRNGSNYFSAVTYDPYDAAERIFVNLKDCNRPGNPGDYIDVIVETSTGDQETIRLYRDEGQASATGQEDNTMYHNYDYGLPLSAVWTELKAEDGMLQVKPDDTLVVRYTDTECDAYSCEDYAYDIVDLQSWCVSTALYSGAGAAFGGTSFRVHWGEVAVFGDVDFTGKYWNTIPGKDRTMPVAQTANMYTGANRNDRWVDIYVGGVVNGHNPEYHQPYYDDPYYVNVYQNIPDDVLGCIQAPMDYEAVKNFAKRADVYYYAVDKSSSEVMKLNKDGTETGPFDLEALIADPDYGHRGFIFVDIVDAPNNPKTGDEIDAMDMTDSLWPEFHFRGNFFYKGVLYIVGNIQMTGLGAGTPILAETPPLNDKPQVFFPEAGGEGVLDDLPVTYDTSGPSGIPINIEAHIDGLLYIEGQLDITGDPMIYGSLGVERGYIGNGNPEIWYNYKQGKGCVYEECCQLEIHPKDADVAPGETITLEASGGPGGFLTWSLLDDPWDANGTIVKTGPTTAEYTAPNSVWIWDEVQVEDIGGCQPGTTRVRVVCDPLEIEGPATVEIGKKVKYTVASGSGNYEWWAWSSVPPDSGVIDMYSGMFTGLSQGAINIYVTDKDTLCWGRRTINVVNLPEDCDVVYFNDFDGNEIGSFRSQWLSCSDIGIAGDPNCVGQDDWQIGPPMGQCEDPDTAFSGLNVLGNDVGADKWNGCYQQNVANYIVSPKIDASRATNLEIHFEKWADIGMWDTGKVLGCCNCSSPEDFVELARFTNEHDDSWDHFQFVIPAGVCDNPDYLFIMFSLESDDMQENGGWNIDDVLICGDCIGDQCFK